MPIYSVDNAYMSYATGDDLTAWDNAYAALIEAELQALDKFDITTNQVGVDYSDPETEEVGYMSTAQYPIQSTTGYKEAYLSIPMFLQTGIAPMVTLGACATAGADPYTHTITLASPTTQTPLKFGIHFEKELTSEDLRYDFFGLMPDFWRVYCGDDRARWKARQVLGARFACSDATAGDIAEPTKQALSIYEWNDLKHASGALTVTYNSNPLEFNIHGIDLTVKRTRPLWGVKNSSGFPSEAFISGCYLELRVDGYVDGDNIRTIMATKPESYAGALDADFKWYKSADREFDIDINYLYLVPDQDILNERNWYERKTLRFIPLNSSTSITIVPEDSLAEAYYENTA